jgi:hypothetical protein
MSYDWISNSGHFGGGGNCIIRLLHLALRTWVSGPGSLVAGGHGLCGRFRHRKSLWPVSPQKTLPERHRTDGRTQQVTLGCGISILGPGFHNRCTCILLMAWLPGMTQFWLQGYVVPCSKKRSQVLKTMSWKPYPAVAVPVLVRLPRKEWRVGQTDGQTDSRSTADTKRKQRIKVKQMSKQTPQRAPVVAINWLLKHPLGDFRNELQ